MKHFLENLNRYWVAPIVTIVGGLLGIYFTVINEKLKRSIDTIETSLRQKEFENNLRFHLYDEVKSAVTTKNKDVQNATLLIVNEMLADDSLFRDKLITLLLTSPNTDTSVLIAQKEMDIKTDSFQIEEAPVAADRDEYMIDIFYLEELEGEAFSRAKKIKDMLTKTYPDYKLRLRRLPRNINAQSGYRLSRNEIRFEEEEGELANSIKQQIDSSKIFRIENLRLHKIAYNTPKYISVFVRNM